MHRSNGLKQIGLGLYNFHDTYKRFPPAVRRDEAGRELCSWRYQIAPFLEARMLGVDFSDRWYDAANRYDASRPNLSYCWSDAPFPESLHTNVVAVTGPGTAFDGERVTRLSDMDSDTILVIEIAASDTHWMEPGDLPIENVTDSILQGLEGDGLLVLFADASVWFIPSDVPLADLEKFFTIEGAKRYDRDQLLVSHRK